MAITRTNSQNSSLSYVGRTIEVRTFEARRNHSDTLDYSDWQVTKCTEALVYCGRTMKVYDHDLNAQRDVERPIEQRFEWIDCTNLFVWRGADHVSAEVDVQFPLAEPELVEDWCAWHVHIEEKQAKYLAHLEAQSAKVREVENRKRIAREEASKNAPVKGRRMKVTSGPNAGYEGTVAFINSSGKALIKPDALWQDRKADGVWATPKQLEPLAQ